MTLKTEMVGLVMVVQFLPCITILAWYMLWPFVCLSVCICVVTSWCPTKMAKWIELIFFGMEASFDLSYTV